MANISSYNQLSSWNEDDDLLFVQQPDAPKKAHPSQMKEYILGGLDVASVGGTGKYISEISEADGKINATAETMDAVPTEGSTKAVTSGGTKTYVDNVVATKRSLTVSSSVIGSAVNVANATATNPYTTPHEGFVRFGGPSCLTVNTYRMMKSSANEDYKGMWLPKGASIYFTDGTPPLAQWFNCSNE